MISPRAALGSGVFFAIYARECDVLGGAGREGFRPVHARDAQLRRDARTDPEREIRRGSRFPDITDRFRLGRTITPAVGDHQQVYRASRRPRRMRARTILETIRI